MKLLREMQTEDINAVVRVIGSQSEEDAEEAAAGYEEVGGIMDQYVLEHEGKIIGITGFSTPPGCDETHWLSWTYVDKKHAGQGHGRKMLTELLNFLKDKNGRKVFIKVSDYVDDEDGDIYAAALHLYQSLGFEIELTHKDYYTPNEAQIILGQRLKHLESNPVQNEDCPVRFNAVFEIDETDDAYSFGWHDESEEIFNQEDVKVGLDQVKKDEGRIVFLSFPSNYNGVSSTLLASGFTNAGVLDDYYEDGIHEQHFCYRM